MTDTTPGSVDDLGKQLRALYDKTCDAYACSKMDYSDRINAGLIAVYTYGVRKGRLELKCGPQS